MLAVVVSLLLIVSASLLLYQYWTRALADDARTAEPEAPLRALAADQAAPAPSLRIDTAA